MTVTRRGLVDGHMAWKATCALGLLALVAITWSTFIEVHRVDDASHWVSIWFRFWVLFYCLFLVCLIDLFCFFKPQFRGRLYTATALGIFFPLLFWIFIVCTKGRFLTLLIHSGLELISIPGKLLLVILGRPMILQHDHFSTIYEAQQLLIFLPLNVLAWMFLSWIVLLCRRFFSPEPGTQVSSALPTLGLSLIFLGFIALYGPGGELTSTTLLLISASEGMYSTVSFGILSIVKPGLAAALPYWLMAALFVGFQIYRRQ